MRANSKGASQQPAATAKPLRIILQPGQVVIIQVAEASGAVPPVAMAELLAGASPQSDMSSESPSRKPDSSSESPSASRDLSGRP